MRSSVSRGVRALFLAAGMALAPFAATAANLGYGEFRGEFTGHPWPAHVVEAALGAGAPDLRYMGSWFYGFEFGEPDFTINVTSYGKKIGGGWAYDGFGTIAPLQEPIQMLLAVKYGPYFGLFHYQEVNPGDDGLLSTSPAATGVALHTRSRGKPYALEYVKAYWAELPPSPVPVPPGLALLMTAIGSLFGALRLRQRG
jgi:hypothetical protein